MVIGWQDLALAMTEGKSIGEGGVRGWGGCHRETGYKKEEKLSGSSSKTWKHHGKRVTHSDPRSNMSWQEKRTSKGTILSLLESLPVLIAVKGQVALVGEPGMRASDRIFL